MGSRKKTTLKLPEDPHGKQAAKNGTAKGERILPVAFHWKMKKAFQGEEHGKLTRR